MDPREERLASVARIFQTLHRIRFSEILEGGEGEAGLCLPEFTIVLCVDRMKAAGHGRVLVSDLVRELPSSPQAISKYLKLLEDKGYIKRSSVRFDRRSTEIELTEAGRKAFLASKDRMNSFFHDIFSEVSDEELDKMIAFLDRICDAMMKKAFNACPERSSSARIKTRV